MFFLSLLDSLFFARVKLFGVIFVHIKVYLFGIDQLLHQCAFLYLISSTYSSDLVFLMVASFLAQLNVFSSFSFSVCIISLKFFKRGKVN